MGGIEDITDTLLESCKELHSHKEQILDNTLLDKCKSIFEDNYNEDLLNENEKRTFFERLGESIIYSSKAHACKSSDTPENRPNQPNI